MPVFTPFEDGEPGTAATFNKRFDEIATAISAGGDSGVWRRLIPLNAIVSSPPQISVLIPAGYTQIILMALLRGDAAQQSVDLLVTFNNDTNPANYYVGNVIYSSSYTVYSQLATGANGIKLNGALIGASNTDGRVSVLELSLLDYTNTTTAKTALIKNTSNDSSGAVQYTQGGAVFLPTGAVTSMQINSLTGNIQLGSKYALYGVL